MPPVIVSRLIASTTEALEERKARQQEKKFTDKSLTRALSGLGLSGSPKPASPQACPHALVEYGTCVNILQKLVQDEQGLSLSSWLKFSRVCKTWRAAMQEVPVALSFPRKLSTRQTEELCRTKLRIASITFSEQETFGLSLLETLEFREHQAPYLKRVWNLELGGNQEVAALRPYQLRSLYACRPAQHVAPACVFSSAPIMHMDKLQLLSLRGYTHLQLALVPASVDTLQIGPAVVMEELSHKVDRVIMNGGKAMYLVEALTPYFTSARSLSAYASRMVGRTVEPYRPGGAAVQDVSGSSCIVEDIQLEFDNLVVLDPLASTTWNCRNTTRGLELLKEKMGGDFIHTEGGGKLHSTRIKLNRVRKKRKARFAV